MASPNDALAKACCAELYQSEWVHLLLGDTLHPGGLRLTNLLGKLMGLKPDDWVIDLASARGASAIAVSRAFHCRVVGVEFGRGATLVADANARNAPVIPTTFFIQSDAEALPLRSSTFDAAFAECSVSIFTKKAQAIQEVSRTLRPGGKFGLSDVTLEPGCLPPELTGQVGQMLCLTEALNVEGYQRLLQQGGMELLRREDASGEIISLLDDLDSKLEAFMAWQSLFGGTPEELSWLHNAPDLIAKMRLLVETGKLGYWLFVAKKPG